MRQNQEIWQIFRWIWCNFLKFERNSCIWARFSTISALEALFQVQKLQKKWFRVNREPQKLKNRLFCRFRNGRKRKEIWVQKFEKGRKSHVMTEDFFDSILRVWCISGNLIINYRRTCWKCEICCLYDVRTQFIKWNWNKKTKTNNVTGKLKNKQMKKKQS